MKKSLLLLIALFAITSVDVYAQDDGEAKLRWSGHVTNRFWDNWEISVGGGASSLDLNLLGGDKEPGKFWNRINWNANFALTKWVTPIIGMRLQLDAGEFQNYSNAPNTYGNGVFKTPYFFAHGDIMVNLSNWIGGYREDRVYYAVPYAGFGYTALSWTDNSIGESNNEFAFTLGTLNKFRVCRQLDIQLDLRSWLFPTRGLPTEIAQGSGSSYALAFSASLGVAYRFNKRNWDPAVTVADVEGYITLVEALNADLAAAVVMCDAEASKVDKLQSENSTLKRDLEECRKRPREVKEVTTSDGVVFFNIGTSTLTPYAKATLDTYIASIKAGNTPLTVTGYADKETGSAAINERLSKERAETVKAYMVDRGIAASRITTAWVGDTIQMFSGKDAELTNRCAVIK